MSVDFKVVPIRPGGMAGDNEPKYYPALTNRKTVDLRKLSQDMSDKSTLHTADIYGVIQMLTEIIPKYLQRGHNIKLGDLGTFSLSVRGEGESEPEKVNSSNIKEVRMNFRPSRYLKDTLKHTEFKKV